MIRFHCPCCPRLVAFPGPTAVCDCGALLELAGFKPLPRIIRSVAAQPPTRRKLSLEDRVRLLEDIVREEIVRR
jgi:hypothetical protein